MNAATLRGLLKYVQVWTLSVREWTPNAGNAIGLDLGKYGKRRTSAPQLSCTIALIVKWVKYDPGNDPVRAPFGTGPIGDLNTWDAYRFRRTMQGSTYLG